MIYGTKLIYKYTEEIPVVNEKGETVITDDGDILTTEKQKTLDLTFSALTFLIYKNHTGREFMVDYITAASDADKKWQGNTQLLEKAKTDFDSLTIEEKEKVTGLGLDSNIEFFMNAIAAMVATTEYPIKRDFAEIINELPLFEMMQDDQFNTELFSLLSFRLKKNLRTQKTKNPI